MSAPVTFSWPLTQERVETLANEIYLLQDLLNRAVPGCARGEKVSRLLNDLRAHVVAAGGEDPFPFFGFELVFPDTPVPTWPDPKYLRFEDVEAQA